MTKFQYAISPKSQWSEPIDAVNLQYKEKTLVQIALEDRDRDSFGFIPQIAEVRSPFLHSVDQNSILMLIHKDSVKPHQHVRWRRAPLSIISRP